MSRAWVKPNSARLDSFAALTNLYRAPYNEQLNIYQIIENMDIWWYMNNNPALISCWNIETELDIVLKFLFDLKK
jgi:hypothetical protein